MLFKMPKYRAKMIKYKKEKAIIKNILQQNNIRKQIIEAQLML